MPTARKRSRTLKTSANPSHQKANDDRTQTQTQTTETEKIVSSYEETRQKTIKENLERMQKLGIFDLSLKLKPSTNKNPNARKPLRRSSLLPPQSRARRSSRLQNVTPVSYKANQQFFVPVPTELSTREGKGKKLKNKKGKAEKLLNFTAVSYKENEENEEKEPFVLVPTHPSFREEKEKKLENNKGKGKELPPLVSTRRSSRLETLAPVHYFDVEESSLENEDIYSEEEESSSDGEEDPKPEVKGMLCHQCRQETLGDCTNCSQCNMDQGQVCGDCLYRRYGEYVEVVKQNPSWICPVCRGICNCTPCREEQKPSSDSDSSSESSDGSSSQGHDIGDNLDGEEVDMEESLALFYQRAKESRLQLQAPNLDGEEVDMEESLALFYQRAKESRLQLQAPNLDGEEVDMEESLALFYHRVEQSRLQL